MTTVEFLDRNLSGSFQKWLGLPCSLTSTALYGLRNTLLLPFSGLTGPGGHHGDVQSGLGPLPKASGQSDLRQEHTQDSRRRSKQAWRKRSEQGSRTPASGSVDKVGG